MEQAAKNPLETASKSSHRMSGLDALLSRYPDARHLWQVAAAVAPAGFTLDGYLVDGRVVILQQFTDHRRGSWDLYAPASDSGRIDDTLDAIAQPAACRSKRCDYFTHYLAYGPAELTHEGYHAACIKNGEAQKRADEWFKAHPLAVKLPEGLDQLCRTWEARVRA